MEHQKFLQQALSQAEIRRGFCAPNPAVGAIVVKNSKIIAVGHHFASGHPHAEVDALQKLGEEAEGATLYVTLEPCCHYGKTPPCTELIIKHKLACVVYGMSDPNPLVSGKGKQQVENAGITCLCLPLPEIIQFYNSYCYWWKTKKPFITAKIAISLDAKIAGIHGNPVAITGEAARLFTHQQRKRADALLTTAKTIICDNPQLNIRLPNENYRKPVYVLDSNLVTPLTSAIFSSAERVIILHNQNVDSKKIALFTATGIRCQAVNHTAKGLDLQAVIEIIGQDGVHDLWVEAGGHCFSTFVQQNLAHKIYIYIAAKCLGKKAIDAFTVEENIFAHYKFDNWQPLGDDICGEMSLL